MRIFPTPTGQLQIYPTPNGQAPVSGQMSAIPKPKYTYDANVAKQQAELNAKGAGLKVDGFLGPLTQAAITKYGGQSNSNVGGQMGAIQGSQAPLNPYNPSNGIIPPETDMSGSTANTAPTSTPNPFEAQYQALLNPSAEENQLSQDQINLQDSYRQGNQNIADKTIPMTYITGQQQSLENRFQNSEIPLAQKLALAQQKRQASLDSVKFQLDRADKETARQDTLAQNKLDEAYRNKALESPKSGSQPGSIQEYEYAKSQGYTGSFNDYQNSDANRKISIAKAGASGLTPYQETNAFNSIVGKYNSSPLIMAADRVPVLQATIQNIKNNPGDAAQQLNLSYAYIQALDTYQSAVREGELGLVNSIDSKVGQLNNYVQQMQNGQIVRPEIAIQIANAAQTLVDTINSAAKNKAKAFESQANVAGIGSQWQQYTSGFNSSYNNPTPQPQSSGGYSIKSGDTFFKLAQANGTTVAALQAANPGVNVNNLKVGQKINLPGQSQGGSGSNPLGI